MTGGLPVWMRGAYNRSIKKLVGNQPAVGDGVESSLFNVPASPYPGYSLIGVEFNGQQVYTATAAEALLVGGTTLISALGRVDCREASNKGSIITTGLMAQQMTRYLFRREVVQDTLIAFQAQGVQTCEWNLFVPFVGQGNCTAQLTAGNIMDVFAGDVSQTTTLISVYGVYAPTNLVQSRIMVRETDIPAISSGSIASNLNSLEGVSLDALIYANAFDVATGAVETFQRHGYDDGKISINDLAMEVYVTNDMYLQQLTRTAGAFVVNLAGATFSKGGSMFIQPEFSAATSPQVMSIQTV
jgi:hypothetical protein